jgi:segregation and condensation protein B
MTPEDPPVPQTDLDPTIVPPTDADLTAGAPGSGAPGSGAPGSGAPGSGAPGSGAPGSGAPGSGAPGSGALEEVAPAALRPGLEAILFLADEPVEVEVLAEVLAHPADVVVAELEALAAEYLESGRGMEVRRAAGGWRMYSAALAKPAVERWALSGRTGRLTQAALETLAVIAYKQPISRQEIGDIRGVNADGAVRSLVARGYVVQVGRDEGPGQALLYGTTPVLLERLGLDSLDELPPLTDFLPEAPAPDEPELGALKEVRRRLAAGADLDARSTDPSTNTGPDAEPDEADDALPPPATAAGRSRADAGMDELTDRLERAARSAVDRLRQAVSAGEEADRTAEGADPTGEGADRTAEGTGAGEEHERA